MSYNASQIYNATGWQLAVEVNQAVDYWIGLGFMIMLYVLVFQWQRQNTQDAAEAFFISSYFTGVVGLILFLLEFITSYMFFTFVVLAGVSLFFHLLRGGRAYG
jgi:hypothetical protein